MPRLFLFGLLSFTFAVFKQDFDLHEIFSLFPLFVYFWYLASGGAVAGAEENKARVLIPRDITHAEGKKERKSSI